MGAISELSTAGGVLRRNPIIFIATLLAALAGGLSTVGQMTTGNVAVVVVLWIVSILLTPFFTGGLLGMAERGLTGSAGLRTLFAEGASNYLSILGGSILFGVAFIAVYIAYAIIALIIGFGASAVFSMGGGTGTGLLGLGFGLVFTLLILLAIPLFFLLFLFLYFFDVAIVVGDERAWSGIKRSTGFVRSNFASAFGFTIITGILGLIAAIPTFWLIFSTGNFSSPSVGSGVFAGNVSMSRVVLPALALIIFSTLFNAFIYAYKVALYAGLTEAESSEQADMAD